MTRIDFTNEKKFTPVIRLKLFLIILILFLPFNFSQGAEFLGFGFYGGLQYDVGNLNSTDAQFIAQQNAILGASVKVDRGPFFIRTGAERSIVISEGEIKNNSAGKITKLRIEYTSIPGYMGLNFKIRNRGKFYSGFGVTYILGSGTIHTSDKKYKLNDNLYGLGILTGVQLRAGINIRVYAEWEYISAKTDPVVRSDTTKTWEDFGVDYSGHRIHFGFSYYIF